MHMFLFPSTTRKLRRGRGARGGGRARAKSLVGLASLIFYFNLVCVSVYYICNCRLYSTVFSIFQREYFGTFYGSSSTFNHHHTPKKHFRFHSSSFKFQWVYDLSLFYCNVKIDCCCALSLAHPADFIKFRH